VPEATVPSLHLQPLLWIDGKCAHLSRLCVIEGAMMRDPSITNELRQHGEGTGSQSLVDERFLSRKSLYGGAAGQLIFAGGCVDNFRIELSNGAKSSRLAAVLSIQWLTENILAACRVIADVKPVDGSLPMRKSGLRESFCELRGCPSSEPVPTRFE
jgi:hypothetical protein